MQGSAETMILDQRAEVLKGQLKFYEIIASEGFGPSSKDRDNPLLSAMTIGTAQASGQIARAGRPSLQRPVRLHRRHSVPGAKSTVI
jgi:hypothetical protein